MSNPADSESFASLIPSNSASSAGLSELGPESIAARVVKKGVRHTMAHAIRAVEEIAHDYHPRSDLKHERVDEYLRIKVQECGTLGQLRTNQEAVIYLGAPGGGAPGPHTLVQIFIRRDLSEENKRFRLVHELGHVLMKFERRQPNQSFPQTLGNEDETWCDEFAAQVCAMLQFVYTDTSFQHASKFPSKGRITAEQRKRFAEIFAAERRRWKPVDPAPEPSAN